MRENSNTYFQCIWLSQINLSLLQNIYLDFMRENSNTYFRYIWHSQSFVFSAEIQNCQFLNKNGTFAPVWYFDFFTFLQFNKSLHSKPVSIFSVKIQIFNKLEIKSRTLMRQFSNIVIDQKGVILLNLLPQLCSVFCNLEQTITHEVAPWWAEPRHQKFPTKRMWAQFRRGWHILILFSLCSLTNSQWHKDGLEVSFWNLFHFWILFHFLESNFWILFHF